MNIKKILVSVILIYMFFLTGCISIKYNDIEKYMPELKFNYNNISVCVEDVKCNDIVIFQEDFSYIERKEINFYLTIYNNSNEQIEIYLHDLKAYEKEKLEKYEVNDIFPLKSIDGDSKKDIYVTFLVDKDMTENKYIFEFSIDDNRVVFHLYENNS